MTTTDAVVVDDDPGVGASRALEIGFAVSALAITATYLVLSTRIDLRRAAAAGQLDARFWPLVLGAAGVAVAVLLLVIALTRPPASREDIELVRPGGVLRVVITSALTLGYVAAWGVGAVVAFGYRIQLFPILTALFMLALMLVYGQRRWLGLVIYPVAVTALIYALFGILLRVPL